MNLLVTMTLGGLWHGAGWTFLIWGAYHGVLLMLNHAWRSISLKSSLYFRLPAALSVGLTFVSVIWDG